MTRNLDRLLRPSSIAVIGGGWAGNNIVEQSLKMGFSGSIWPVHPKADRIHDQEVFRRIEDLPSAPDAAFIGINRHATIDAVEELNSIGAGGAVCFASGFKEAASEDEEGDSLQDALLQAAGEMPILGPNCYGFINYLDGALLWPDQHGGKSSDRGVAIITQSSNIAINLTMQRRGLPISYILTAGNQAQISLAEMAYSVLQDDRVTALGLHIEGFGDLRAYEAMAAEAHRLNKPIIALKIGKSEQARAATISHTASLAGSDAGSSAFLKRLGIASVSSLSELLETLKLLHVLGPMKSSRITSMSCSGGEASLIADMAVGKDISFPPLKEQQKQRLRSALGPLVALANPLDYHTYIWGDTEKMTETFSAIAEEENDLNLLVIDFPRNDVCSDEAWEPATSALLNAQKKNGANYAMVSTIPETMPEHIAERLHKEGVISFNGLEGAIAAIDTAVKVGAYTSSPILLPAETDTETVVWSEDEAKSKLLKYNLNVPNSAAANSAEEAAEKADEIGYPVVLKGVGIAHKSDVGAVKLNLKNTGEVIDAARSMPCTQFLVEEMVQDTVAELLVGVVKDPAHGFVLSLAAGGVLTELLKDSVSMLVPTDRQEVEIALKQLRINKVLQGYRGKPAASINAILDAVENLQKFVIDHVSELEEIEINPLICGTSHAVVADALVRVSCNKN